MSVAVCILAKNEADSIARILAQIAEQSIVTSGADEIDIHVVANGCTDDTVRIAQESAPRFDGTNANLHVHDVQPGGKSRAWNLSVHSLTGQRAEFLIFLDADIRFVDERVLGELLTSLEDRPAALVCSGYPIKDISVKSEKSLIDRFSLAVSERSRHVGAINGSLYAARAAALREIWLPNQTPGEDGFLNAMVTTRGFTAPPNPATVISAARPTHYYQAHSPFGFFLHERRMIVGTMINVWIFERLWLLNLESSAGRMIEVWNEEDPDWVERLIQDRAKKRMWLVPSTVLFGRLIGDSAAPWWKRLAGFPVALMATLLTVPAAIAANRRLKQFGAAGTW